MTLRNISGFAAVALVAVGFAAPAAMAKPAGGAAAVKMIDTDNDGTVDMKEVEAVPPPPSIVSRRIPTAPSTRRS